MDCLTLLCSTNSMCYSSAPGLMKKMCASQMGCFHVSILNTEENRMSSAVT